MKTKLVAAALVALLAVGCQKANAGNWAVAGGYSSGGGSIAVRGSSGHNHGHGHYRGGYRGYGYGGVVVAPYPVYAPVYSPIYTNGYPIDPYRGYRTYPTVVYTDPVSELSAYCRPGVSKVESGNIVVYCNN